MIFSKARTFLSALIILQLLNVQIQSAFATDAITQSSSEYAQAVSNAEAKLSKKLSPRSESELIKLAYVVFKIDVKFRNHMFHKEVVKDPILAKALVDALDFSDGTETKIDTKGMDLSASEEHRAKMIEKADPVLTFLGATAESDGTLTATNSQTFALRLQNLLHPKDLETAKSYQGDMTMTHIMLTLLVLSGGMGVFVLMLGLIAGATFGGLTAPVWMYLILAGTVAIGIFAIVEIWRTQFHIWQPGDPIN